MYEVLFMDGHTVRLPFVPMYLRNTNSSVLSPTWVIIENVGLVLVDT